MTQTSINLPAGRRLHLHVVKRQKRFDDKPLLPKLGEVRRVRKGNKISRYFRHIFEHNKIRRILGANLAVFAIASSFLPGQVNTYNADEITVSKTPLVLTTEIKVRYPVDKVKINQYYSFYHPGVDFEGITGDNVYPFMNGRIEAVGYSQIGYGNAIYVVHENNLASLYAHLSKIEVEEGQLVDTKTVIGLLGATGRASGDHLHFEIRKDGLPINPSSFLPL